MPSALSWTQALPSPVESHLRPPQVRLHHAPLAQRIHNRPAGGGERVAHGGVAVEDPGVAPRVAVVVL